jgi:hypothetical protein
VLLLGFPEKILNSNEGSFIEPIKTGKIKARKDIPKSD